MFVYIYDKIYLLIRSGMWNILLLLVSKIHDHNDILKICTQLFIAYYLLNAKITISGSIIN